MEVFFIGYLREVRHGGVVVTWPAMGEVVDGMHIGGGHDLANDGEIAIGREHVRRHWSTDRRR
jgi:hypothetical protein